MHNLLHLHPQPPSNHAMDRNSSNGRKNAPHKIQSGFLEMSCFGGKKRSFQGIFGSENVILGRFWVKTCDFRSFLD